MRFILFHEHVQKHFNVQVLAFAASHPRVFMGRTLTPSNVSGKLETAKQKREREREKSVGKAFIVVSFILTVDSISSKLSHSGSFYNFYD